MEDCRAFPPFRRGNEEHDVLILHDIHILMNDANFTEKTWNIDHAMIDISILYTSSCNHIYVQYIRTEFIEIMYLSTLQQKIKYL